jgi:chromosomal replication initiator protein
LKPDFPGSSGRARADGYLLTRFVPVPENRSAFLAVQHVADRACARRPPSSGNPLLIHGAPGTGKTHVVSGLVEEVIRRSPQLAVAVRAARDLEMESQGHASELDCDLFICEDVQHLPERAAGPLVQLMDHLSAHRQQMVFTASVGPGQLVHLPARLTSRLASGLVVGIEPLSASSRLVLLRDKAQRRQLAVSADVLAWLAEHLTGGGRQLDGALIHLEALARLSPRRLDVATVSEHFREHVEATRPTVERIAQRVGGYFQVEPRRLQSAQRSWNVLLPRQVGMYLARQLTGLSLEQIGAYFGGRDHSTVLHACRKVESALAQDASVAGVVRRLQAELA